MRSKAAVAALVTAGLWAVAAHTTAAALDDTPATILLRGIAKRITANSGQLPNYTCVQNITRVQYAPPFSSRGNACGSKAERGTKLYQDRLRLDVAVVDNRETFAWAGAKRFETSEIDTLIQGTSGSGDFGSFLVAAFGKGVSRYVYKGEEDTDIGKLAKFLYEVPVGQSMYKMRVGRDYATVGYHGTFYADAKEADVRRLIIDADDFPQAAGVCHVVDTMDYRRVQMGDHDFLLPETTSMEVLYFSGQSSFNQTQYTGCKQYVGESTIRFDDPEEQKITAEEKLEAQVPLPVKTKLQLALTAPVDLYRASAGDPIIATVLKDVVKDKKVLVHANAKLHGRLIRVEQDFPQPFPHWVIGISFETIERAGQEQAIRLEALDDGMRSHMPQTFGRGRDQVSSLPRHKKNSGTGVFIFATAENPHLDSSFRSEWQVLESPTPPAPAAPAR